MMNSYKKGRQYEDALAKEGIGKRQPGSGARYTAKEDHVGVGLYKGWLLQAKNKSGQKNFSLTVKDLNALRRNSSMVGLSGVMLINFGEPGEYAVVRKVDLESLLEIANERNGD